MDIVLARASTHQLKEFTKVQGISSINLHTSRDKDHQGIGIVGRLDVHTLHSMLNSSDGLELVDDVLCPLELLALERQHGPWVLEEANDR